MLTWKQIFRENRRKWLAECIDSHIWRSKLHPVLALQSIIIMYNCTATVHTTKKYKWCLIIQQGICSQTSAGTDICSFGNITPSWSFSGPHNPYNGKKVIFFALLCILGPFWSPQGQWADVTASAVFRTPFGGCRSTALLTFGKFKLGQAWLKVNLENAKFADKSAQPA